MVRIILHCFGIAALVTHFPAATTITAQNTSADPWLTSTTKERFQPQRAADAPLQMDLPKKAWMVLPSSGSVLLTLASRRGDAVAMVERSTLRLALEGDDITEVFAQIEMDAIKDRQPKASAFQSRVLDVGPRRLVAIEYTRTGVLGGERVRQYSLPIGKHLYRLACISSTPQFAHYDAVFSHMAASFTATE